MKIEKSRVVITEIPVFESIAVEPRGAVFGVVTITLSSDSDSWIFTPDELTGLHDALGAALEEARLMAGLPAASYDDGPWPTMDDIPASVFLVRDDDGDAWARHAETGPWRMVSGDNDIRPGNYGPYTRV